ncbi:MAG: hypothetical protein OQL08_04675 [Gammaproteobacteria bacterium]|nr:hypothetical protein [Gammaproteobacteria bacterium]
MTEPSSVAQDGHSPSSIRFWLEEARLLKETAEQSWGANRAVVEQVKLIYGPQQDRALHQTTDELGVELNLLYRYLVSLAIQYLAIGMLIDRDPSYFLPQPPGHRIVALLETCGVVMTPQQRQLLLEIENAYEWAERFAVGALRNGHDELRQLTHQLSIKDCLSVEEKAALDQLYQTLRATAQRQGATG